MKKLVKENLENPMNDVYEFGDSLVNKLKEMGFNAMFTGAGRGGRKNEPTVAIEIEGSEFGFELSSNNDVILFNENRGGHYMRHRKNLGSLDSIELEENLEDLLV